ncbi:hypothetical protein [Pseudomonas sp. LRF_L74]|uniref:hypothetical protein n=1 Tax=Pseudomonas sp. LRF_L74 TaxID=3369422 RepID=UPI003F60B0AF
MRLPLLLIIVLWVHLGDLGSAWLYNIWPHAADLRLLRDSLVIATAACCLATLRLPVGIILPMLGYGALALSYLLIGVGNAPRGLQISSFGTLMIPPLFVLVGYYCIRNLRDLHMLAAWLVLLAIASTAFGAWEQQHTDFWLTTMHYPQYMLEVKGLKLGANPLDGLPWNFYGGVDLQRRAAGLLASPLAQGMFLAVSAVLVIAWLDARARLLGLLLSAFLFAGIWMSGTRGAMFAGGLALLGYLLGNRSLLPGRGWRWLILGTTLLAIVVASWNILIMSINLLDGSSVGHWAALKKNLVDLPRVLFTGAGLGQQGAMAGQAAASTIGGGEGAIFSIAFQLGVPAALLFLLFYGNMSWMFWRTYRHHGSALALAAFWLSVGLTITLVTSEHMLAVSGTGAFWLLCGGVLRSLYRLPSPALKHSHEN